ncbi:YqjF family protein [Herbiconiux sp. UC225_62]|uniref:YqjF family protein n=1 Tax=Herbiconiux sp. UC225_62 TaxID=3350168 RepID=UPI0036D230F7
MDVEPLSRTAPPLPGGPLHEQDWQSLTFLHWRVDPSTVAPHLPPGTRPDVFDGSAWVGLIPFRLANATVPGARALGPIPYAGTFPEINVRLYSVDDSGRRGVVFVSLESSRLAAVSAAHLLFGLPYRWARMSITTDAEGTISYRSERLGENGFGGSPGPHSRVDARPGTEDRSNDELAVFLTARWGLHIARGGRTRFIPNEHEPWRIVDAELRFLDDELLDAEGFPGLAGRPPDSVLFSPGVHTAFGHALPGGRG